MELWSAWERLYVAVQLTILPAFQGPRLPPNLQLETVNLGLKAI